MYSIHMALLFNFSTFLGNFVKNCISKAKISIFFLILPKKCVNHTNYQLKNKKNYGGYIGAKRNQVEQ